MGEGYTTGEGFRYASTFASPATINKPLQLQEGVDELYSALDSLRTDASAYVNLSRLQLALRGLESSNGRAIVRVAVLAMTFDGARQLARSLIRVLLADFLGEEAQWEKELIQGGTPANSGRDLLIRYVVQFPLSYHNFN